ncbi:Uncharacterised protein [Vibrio cholerae]|nr:Uncharacterised protein [Vibrio cholerae]
MLYDERAGIQTLLSLLPVSGTAGSSLLHQRSDLAGLDGYASPEHGSYPSSSLGAQCSYLLPHHPCRNL